MKQVFVPKMIYLEGSTGATCKWNCVGLKFRVEVFIFVLYLSSGFLFFFLLRARTGSYCAQGGAAEAVARPRAAGNLAVSAGLRGYQINSKKVQDQELKGRGWRARMSPQEANSVINEGFLFYHFPVLVYTTFHWSFYLLSLSRFGQFR